GPCSMFVIAKVPALGRVAQNPVFYKIWETSTVTWATCQMLMKLQSLCTARKYNNLREPRNYLDNTTETLKNASLIGSCGMIGSIWAFRRMPVNFIGSQNVLIGTGVLSAICSLSCAGVWMTVQVLKMLNTLVNIHRRRDNATSHNNNNT